MIKTLTIANHLSIFILSAFFALVCVDISCARVFTDETGRSVKITSAPYRIVSLAPGITETLYALGLNDQIAGVTTFCDWPPEALKKTRIGGFSNPSLEKIVSLKPDLIIATADGNSKDTVLQIERLGLPVYVINPSGVTGFLNSIVNIGKITDREKEAGRLSAGLQKRLRHITQRIRNKNKPRVFFQLGVEPVFTVGQGTLIHEMIELAGGINVAGKNIARYPVYAAEGIIAAAPEIIIFAPMLNDRNFAAINKFWQNIGDIPAVKNRKIYPIDANLINRASPRIFDAIEIMVMIFHPDIKCTR
jgi:iron complex transport system substrate-binding protein